MKAINISEDWTIEQQEMVMPLLEPIFDSIKVIGKQGSEADYISAIQTLNKNMREPEILALLWIEDNEITFDQTTYGTRVKTFRKMPLKQIEQYRAVMPDFFAFIIPSLISGTLVFFRGFEGVQGLKT